MNKKSVIGIILALVVVGVIVFSFSTREKETQATSVKSGEIKQETIVETLSTTGTLIPEDSQAIYGQGVVNEVKVSVGDHVTKDQVLATYVTGEELKATIDGTVTTVNIKNKEADVNAQAGRPSIVVDNLSTLKIQVGLSKSEASQVKKDQPVKITSEKKEFAGKISEIDPVATTAQAATGGQTTLNTIITFDSAPEGLFAGFDVDCDITTNTVEDAIALPIEALKYNKNNEPFVYLIKDGKAEETKIEVGIQSDSMVEVRSGLKAKDKVILSPDSTIKNGTEVTTK